MYECREGAIIHVLRQLCAKKEEENGYKLVKSAKGAGSATGGLVLDKRYIQSGGGSIFYRCPFSTHVANITESDEDTRLSKYVCVYVRLCERRECLSRCERESESECQGKEGMPAHLLDCWCMCSTHGGPVLPASRL